VVRLLALLLIMVGFELLLWVLLRLLLQVELMFLDGTMLLLMLRMPVDFALLLLVVLLLLLLLVVLLVVLQMMMLMLLLLVVLWDLRLPGLAPAELLVLVLWAHTCGGW
jgi:hypothetical protein